MNTTDLRVFFQENNLLKLKKKLDNYFANLDDTKKIDFLNIIELNYLPNYKVKIKTDLELQPDTGICKTLYNQALEKIKFIEKWILENKGNIPQQETKTDNILLENKYHKIFSDDLGYTLFNEWYNQHKTESKELANFSFIYNDLNKDSLVVCSQPDYVEFLSQLNPPIIIDKVDSRQQVKGNKKFKLYNSNKKRFEA